MSTTKKIFAWILAVVITLGTVYYQRATGPTYPQKHSFSINNKEYKIKLLASSSTDKEAKNQFVIADQDIKAAISYRKYPTQDAWQQLPCERTADTLWAVLPSLAPAGKYEYFVTFSSSSEKVTVAENRPNIIRFKGAVPAWALVPHIIFIFLAMFFASVVGVFVMFKNPRYKLHLTTTFFMLLIGGMIFGPITQNFAFGDYWTGVPYGWDLTDNKTLFAFVVWIIAMFGNRKTDRPWLALLAAIFVLIIFSIPHSLYGSELDHTTGKVIQG